MQGFSQFNLNQGFNPDSLLSDIPWIPSPSQSPSHSHSSDSYSEPEHQIQYTQQCVPGLEQQLINHSSAQHDSWINSNAPLSDLSLTPDFPSANTIVSLLTPPIPVPPSEKQNSRRSRKNSGMKRKSAEPTSNAQFGPGEIQELLLAQELKKKRLARKAELARRSRHRKKMRLAVLEDEVGRLKLELAQMHELRAQDQDRIALLTKQVESSNSFQVGQQDAESPKQSHSQAEMEHELPSLENAIQEVIHAPSQVQAVSLDHLFQKVADRLGCKVTSTEQHLDKIGSDIKTCLPLQLTQWILSQSDNFYNDPSGLWKSLLTNELSLSRDQIQQLSNLRGMIHSHKKIESEVSSTFTKLNHLLRLHVRNSTEKLGKLRNLLTPEQLKAYFSWAHKFGAVCIQIKM